MAWKAFSSLANPAAASDSTSKEPSRLTFSPENNHQPTGQPSSYNLPLQAQFTSSSSQTTFLDRNIVHNLAVTSTVPVFTAAAIATSSSKLSSIGRTVTTTATNACTRRRRPRTVPASYTSGSGGSCKRASSFSGTLPEGSISKCIQTKLLFIATFSLRIDFPSRPQKTSVLYYLHCAPFLCYLLIKMGRRNWLLIELFCQAVASLTTKESGSNL